MLDTISAYNIRNKSKEEAQVLRGIGDREPSFPYLSGLKEDDEVELGTVESSSLYLSALMEEPDVMHQIGDRGPSFPSYTSFSEIDTRPDELDFLDSVPELQTETPSPVFTKSKLQDRVQRLKSQPTSPKSSRMAMEISSNSNHSNSNHTTSSIKQQLSERRRSSLVSMIESMQQSLSGLVNRQTECCK